MESSAKRAPGTPEQQPKPDLRVVKDGGKIAVESSITLPVNEWPDTHVYSSPTPPEIEVDSDFLPDYGA